MPKFPDKGTETLQIREEFSRRRAAKEERKALPFGMDFEVINPLT